MSHEVGHVYRNALDSQEHFILLATQQYRRFGISPQQVQRSSKLRQINQPQTTNEGPSQTKCINTIMLFYRASLLLALTAAVNAVPHRNSWIGEHGWGVSKGQNWGRQNVAVSCNTAAVQIPQGKQAKPTNDAPRYEQILTFISTNPTSTTISRPSTLPRCRRARHTELYVRLEQQHSDTSTSRRRGLSMEHNLPIG